MESSLRGTNTFTVPLDDTKTNNIQVHINVPQLRAENLSLQTWGSSYILANTLHKLNINPNLLPNDGIDILELGAGTGLVGLTAAPLWKKKVVLTDLAPIVPGLQNNIDANADMLNGYGGSVESGTLDWNHPAILDLYRNNEDEEQSSYRNDKDKASIIVAADTVYWEEHPALMEKAIFAWLKPGEHSRVIISYCLRVAYLDAIRELWERLEAGGLEAIQEGRDETGDDWDDEKYQEWCVWRWKWKSDED